MTRAGRPGKAKSHFELRSHVAADHSAACKCEPCVTVRGVTAQVVRDFDVRRMRLLGEPLRGGALRSCNVALKSHSTHHLGSGRHD